MRYLLVAALLAALLALPGTAAHPVAGFPYDLTFAADGTISGTIGGVPVTGAYTGTTSGDFVLMVDGAVFAAGTYECNGGCTFMGTDLLSVATTFSFTSSDLTTPMTGSLTGLFPNHGAWVSAVAQWSQANLTTMSVGQVVRTAAGIQGKAKTSSTLSTTVSPSTTTAPGKIKASSAAGEGPKLIQSAAQPAGATNAASGKAKVAPGLERKGQDRPAQASREVEERGEGGRGKGRDK